MGFMLQPWHLVVFAIAAFLFFLHDRQDVKEALTMRDQDTIGSDQARRVVSSRQLRPRSTRRMEARVKAMTPTAAKLETKVNVTA
jgi:hypothetical protein